MKVQLYVDGKELAKVDEREGDPEDYEDWEVKLMLFAHVLSEYKKKCNIATRVVQRVTGSKRATQNVEMNNILNKILNDAKDWEDDGE
jgi:hypothetical protein